MNDINDYIGKKIGENLTVIGLDPENHHFNSNHWIFRCSCGNEFSSIPCRVFSGHKKSCGCLKIKSAYIHGCNQDQFYPTWWAMMQRCYNKENRNYKNYGARGITVCNEWHNPITFIEWAYITVGQKFNNLTLDRIDNNGSYNPQNCKWSTQKEQGRNRRTNVIIEYNGELKCLCEWAEQFDINPVTIRYRMKRGWSVERAFTEPVNKKHSHKRLDSKNKKD